MNGVLEPKPQSKRRRRVWALIFLVFIPLCGGGIQIIRWGMAMMREMKVLKGELDDSNKERQRLAKKIESQGREIDSLKAELASIKNEYGRLKDAQTELQHQELAVKQGLTKLKSKLGGNKEAMLQLMTEISQKEAELKKIQDSQTKLLSKLTSLDEYLRTLEKGGLLGKYIAEIVSTGKPKCRGFVNNGILNMADTNRSFRVVFSPDHDPTIVPPTIDSAEDVDHGMASPKNFLDCVKSQISSLPLLRLPPKTATVSLDLPISRFTAAINNSEGSSAGTGL